MVKEIIATLMNVMKFLRKEKESIYLKTFN